MIRIIFILIVFLFFGCSYTYETIQTSEGKTYRIHSYKDDFKQEKYENTLKYKNSYSKMSLSKYDKIVLTGSFSQFIYFQYDSTRIYIDSTLKNYNPLFLSGIITPKIIFCEANKLCRPIQDSSTLWIKNNDSTLSASNRHVVFSSDFLAKRYNWTGNRISISSIKELPYLTKSFKTRVYIIEHKIYQGGPTNNYYFIELTNDQASRNSSLDNFIKNARLTFFKLTRTTAEI